MKKNNETNFQKTIYKIYEIFDHFGVEEFDMFVEMSIAETKERLPELKREALRMVLRNLFKIPVSLWKVIIIG